MRSGTGRLRWCPPDPPGRAHRSGGRRATCTAPRRAVGPHRPRGRRRACRCLRVPAPDATWSSLASQHIIADGLDAPFGYLVRPMIARPQRLSTSRPVRAPPMPNERDTVQSLLAHAASITIGTPVRQRGATVARPTPPCEGVTSGGEVCRVWFLTRSAFRHPGSSGRRGDGERPGRARHRGRSRRRRCHRTGQPVRQSPGVSHRRRHRRWTHRRNRR